MWRNTHGKKPKPKPRRVRPVHAQTAPRLRGLYSDDYFPNHLPVFSRYCSRGYRSDKPSSVIYDFLCNIKNKIITLRRIVKDTRKNFLQRFAPIGVSRRDANNFFASNVVCGGGPSQVLTAKRVPHYTNLLKSVHHIFKPGGCSVRRIQRVMPFTDNKLRTHAKRWKALEWLAPTTTLATLAALLVLPFSVLTATVAAVAALTHSIRLAGWYTKKYWF